MTSNRQYDYQTKMLNPQVTNYGTACRRQPLGLSHCRTLPLPPERVSDGLNMAFGQTSGNSPAVPVCETREAAPAPLSPTCDPWNHLVEPPKKEKELPFGIAARSKLPRQESTQYMPFRGATSSRDADRKKATMEHNERMVRRKEYLTEQNAKNCQTPF